MAMRVRAVVVELTRRRRRGTYEPGNPPGVPGVSEPWRVGDGAAKRMRMDGGAELMAQGGRALSALAAALVLWVTPAAGADQEYHPGRDLYMQYCQSCHGPRATGDGPVAKELETPPPDLTKLAARAGGTFPFLRTMEWIDGTARVTAHGNPEMPVWGERFRAEAPPGMNAEARGKLLWITEYLRTIQD